MKSSELISFRLALKALWKIKHPYAKPLTNNEIDIVLPLFTKPKTKKIKKGSEELCLVCGNPSGHWRHWPNVPAEHYMVPVQTEQSNFHAFQGKEKDAATTKAKAKLV